MTEWIISSSILILIVIALRTIFRGKISLRLQYAIWGLVLLRLLIPVSFGSTDFSVANLANKTDVPAVLVQPAEPSKNLQTDHPVQHPQEQPNEIPTQNFTKNEPVAEENDFDLSGYAIYIVWGMGFICVAGLFLLTNLRFKHKIMGSRYGLDVRKNNLDVYATGEIDTPCLFGIRNPAIYVTYPVADNQTLLRHTLEHEATHHRHGDHIWALIRCVCLAIHWYNPLVWWAAFLSRRDAELACDEATIKRLGEGERAEYGRTLIGMTCQRRANVLITATTMNSGKSGLKERIMLIAKKPKMALYTLLIVLLVASIAVGCTFTGAKTDEPETETESADTETDKWVARGEILDKNGEVIVGKDLEEATTPATEAPATEIPDDAPPVNIPEVLHERPDPNKVCIAVMPTSLATSGEDWYYIIPENQELLLEYYQASAASATKLSWDNDVKQLGWKILYQDEWWIVKEDGSILCDLYGDKSIASEDAKELYSFCRDAVQEAGIGAPVRPEDITGIISATLYWNGGDTVTDPNLLKRAIIVTDPYILQQIETLFSNSRDYGSVQCWMDSRLELALENGETLVLAIATDDCATWMSEGCCYSYGEVTNVGIEGNEEFYSLFATAIIHEKAQEGTDAMAGYWRYVNWRIYSNQYSIDETFALMDMFRDYAVANPGEGIVSTALRTGRGLDGAFAEYYAGVITALYEANPAAFRFACRQMIPEQDVENAVNMLAFHWNITTEEARAKLEADNPQN